MRYKLPRHMVYIGISIAVLLLTVVSVWGANTTAVSQVIKVGHIGCDGFIEKSLDGTYRGYGVAYLNRLSQYTGWKYEYIQGSWQEIQKKLKRGELDMVCNAQKTEDREKIFDFSRYSIGLEETIVYTRKDNQDIYYQDYEHMDGKKVAMFYDSFQNEEFDRYAMDHGFQYEKEMFNTEDEAEEALISGEADLAVFGSISLHDELKIVDKFAPTPYYIITEKGNSELLGLLDKAMGTMKEDSPYLEEELYKNYYVEGTENKEPLFTREEQEFVQSCPPLTVACIDGYYPLSYRNKESGKPDGLLTALTRMVGEISGLRMNFINVDSPCDPQEILESGRADIFSGMLYSQDKMENPGIQLTDSYMTQPAFLVTKSGVSIYEKPRPVAALPAAYTTSKNILPEGLKNGKAYYENSIEECFEDVEEGKADFTIQGICAANYFLQRKRYQNLRLSSMQSVNQQNCLLMSIHADRRLMSVLNKTISCIGDDMINQALGQYSIGRSYEEPLTDIIYEYRFYLIFGIISAAAVLAMTFLFNQKRVSVKYEQQEKMHLKKMMETDDLTGLLNRRAFCSLAAQQIDLHPARKYFILFLDVENFKIFNDMFGIPEGDKLLRYIGEIIKEWCDAHGSLCAHFDADHFVVMTDEPRDAVCAAGQYFHDSIKKYPMDIVIDASSGVYEVDGSTRDVNIMCDRAHLAQTGIKGMHMAHVAVYDDSHRQRILNEQRIVNEMENALSEGQFHVFMQPKYDMNTGGIIGAEALVRWIHPERGVIPPNEFIPVFEHNGFIGHLDLNIFEQTCRYIQNWRKKGKNVPPVSVNLSRADFYNPRLCENLCNIVREYEVPVQLLELEVTETIYAQENISLVAVLEKLRGKGFRILMDDFGSGYSSLNMLKEIPIDEIKLDMRFLSDKDPYQRARNILGTVLKMGNNMNLSVLAEGVETKEQVELLKGFSCHKAQGYFYSRPVEASKFAEML